MLVLLYVIKISDYKQAPELIFDADVKYLHKTQVVGQYIVLTHIQLPL